MDYFFFFFFFAKSKKLYFGGSGIPELKNWVAKPSYGLWRNKTELSQIVTSTFS